jgi:hypothetical protein
MLRGSYRRYPALFVYMAAVFVASLVETSLYIIGYLDATWYRDRHVWTQYLKCYWIDEGIMLALEFVVSFSLIRRATEGASSRQHDAGLGGVQRRSGLRHHVPGALRSHGCHRAMDERVD